MSSDQYVRYYPIGQGSAYGWRGLRAYHNVQKVTDLLVKSHSIPKSHFKNAEKQAAQIRYCLVQAKEYWDASLNVSMATKPLLLYYCCMSLALAEILWKQGGGSSLDASRSKHGHHGLRLSLTEGAGRLAAFNGGLIAKPHIGTERQGTFELWHRTARHSNLSGNVTIHENWGANSGDDIVLMPDTNRINALSSKGIDINQCAGSIPLVAEQAKYLGVEPQLVRARLERRIRDKYNSDIITVIVHPGDRKHIYAVMEQFLIEPRGIPYVDTKEFESGFEVNFEVKIGDNFGLKTPNGINHSEEMVYFLSDKHAPLNEFGFFYVSLYLSGMYARYYPEKWMMEIDSHTDLSALIELICEAASERIPILLLSEFTKCVHIGN